MHTYHHAPREDTDEFGEDSFGFALPARTQLVHVAAGTRRLIGLVRRGEIYTPRSMTSHATLTAALASCGLSPWQPVAAGHIRVQQPEQSERTLRTVIATQRARMADTLDDGFGQHFTDEARTQLFHYGIDPDIAWRCAMHGETRVAGRDPDSDRLVRHLALVRRDIERLMAIEDRAPALRVAIAGRTVCRVGFAAPG